MDRETLKSWVHYGLLNPIDEHHLAHAQATKKLFEENARYREALKNIVLHGTCTENCGYQVDQAREALKGES